MVLQASKFGYLFRFYTVMLSGGELTDLTIVPHLHISVYNWDEGYVSAQKQPGCKKGAALFKMASVKKL